MLMILAGIPVPTADVSAVPREYGEGLSDIRSANLGQGWLVYR